MHPSIESSSTLRPLPSPPEQKTWLVEVKTTDGQYINTQTHHVRSGCPPSYLYRSEGRGYFTIVDENGTTYEYNTSLWSGWPWPRRCRHDPHPARHPGIVLLHHGGSAAGGGAAVFELLTAGPRPLTGRRRARVVKSLVARR
jgi:hypothetical protein